MIRLPLLVRPARPTGIGPFAACLVIVGLVGCGETEDISRYAVPKEPAADAGPFRLPATGESRAPSTSPEPQTAWFVKLLGRDDAVALQRTKFDALLASITLDGDRLTWTLPEGWSEQSGSGMRYATFTADDTDPPLEVSVIRLPVFGERDEYLLQNVNRWRGQVGLQPWSPSEWTEAEPSELVQFDTDQQSVTVVNFAGTTPETGDSRMLAAVLLPLASTVSPPQHAEPAPPADAAATADEPLTYAAPEGWRPGRRSLLRVAAFEVVDGEQKVEITVIAAGGDLLSNVNRWREQVGLEPWTAAELDESADEVTVDGQTARYARLEGPGQTILAAVLPRGPQSWFFKLMGAPELAQREEGRFRSFIESVQFKE